MELEVFRDQNKKGLGTTDLFDVIPTGKKGEVQKVDIGGGTLTFEWGSNIRDNEIKTAVVMLSLTLQKIGKKKIDKLISGAMFPAADENGQMLYTNGISVKGTDLSALMYKEDRKRGKRIFTYLKNLENLRMVYSFPGGDEVVIRLFNRVAYKNGYLSFDVAHFLINRLASSLQGFRLPPILSNNGLAMRLALFVETNQRTNGTYKDSNGDTYKKYVPLNEYKLGDIVFRLKLIATYNSNPSEAIKRIQDAFNEIKSNNPNFPQFTYEPRRKVFESEYKNGLKSRLVK